MYQLRGKILPIVLPNMVEAENFPGHPRLNIPTYNTTILCPSVIDVSISQYSHAVRGET